MPENLCIFKSPLAINIPLSIYTFAFFIFFFSSRFWFDFFNFGYLHHFLAFDSLWFCPISFYFLGFQSLFTCSKLIIVAINITHSQIIQVSIYCHLSLFIFFLTLTLTFLNLSNHFLGLKFACPSLLTLAFISVRLCIKNNKFKYSSSFFRILELVVFDTQSNTYEGQC